MSDVDEWLQAHAEALAAISAETGTDARLVHLVAVLVLAGLDDRTIEDQLVGLTLPPRAGRRRRPDGPAVALARIRRLAA